MATSTQYNPNAELNATLLGAGVSKTVYALITPETERAKIEAFGMDDEQRRRAYLNQFRDAWTAKQDDYHEVFFTFWHKWSSPLVNMDRADFPFYYPTAGASEAIRQIIFDFKANGGEYIAAFEGEYEGYRAMAEAAGLDYSEYSRDEWEDDLSSGGGVLHSFADGTSLFFISQPSAIDGNVWSEFNAFVARMPFRSVVVDLTYVGAVPPQPERINVSDVSVRNVVFSLSKPFGAYYDRIGGVFCRDENLGLFGNRWFKNLSSLSFGTRLMKSYGVFTIPHRYGELQAVMTHKASEQLGIPFARSDVFILANSTINNKTPMADYLRRAQKLRICLTPGMSAEIGTST